MPPRRCARWDTTCEAVGNMMTVAFVGICIMGSPMATNLVQAGFSVIAVDGERARGWAGRHAAHGVAALAEVADELDAVVTMLPTGREVREALTAPAFLAAVRRVSWPST